MRARKAGTVGARAMRVALFKKFKHNSVTRFSDYKKYQINSDYKLNPPKTTDKPDR